MQAQATTDAGDSDREEMTRDPNLTAGSRADENAQRSEPCAASQSIGELTQRNIEAIANLERAAGAHRGRGDRIADWITRFVGSMLFVYIHVVWFAIWVVANSAAFVPARYHFDPYPFTFLTFVVSLEAIFLSTFILISQNHEEGLAQRRSHLDLQVNLLSEQENSKILEMLESIQQHLGIAVDPGARALEERTEPQRLADEIEGLIDPTKSKRK
jgi:uncharacterized membrane protein